MILDMIGNFLIVIAIVFIFFGVYGIYRFNHFYARILVASKVDTVGFITIMLGIIFKKGLSLFSLKVLLILIVMIIINPLATHSIARSAYFSGYKIKKEE